MSDTEELPELPPVPDDETLTEFFQMCAEVMKPDPLHPASQMLKGAISIIVPMRWEIETLRARLGLKTVTDEEAVLLLQAFIKLND